MLGGSRASPWFDTGIERAIQIINAQYGHEVSVNRKDLNKFGGNPAVGMSEISLNSWGADEVFQTENIQLIATSTSASDAGKVVNVEHMTLANDQFTFGTQQVTLDATNPRTTSATLPTAAARWTRIYSTEAMVGDVYIFRSSAFTNGLPDTITTVHNHIPAGENQSQKAGTTIAHSNYFLMFQYWADVIAKTGVAVGIRFKVREYGGAFRTSPRRGCSSHHDLTHRYDVPRIIKPGSDIIITGLSTSASTDSTAGFDGIFADIL